MNEAQLREALGNSRADAIIAITNASTFSEVGGGVCKARINAVFPCDDICEDERYDMIAWFRTAGGGDSNIVEHGWYFTDEDDE